MEHARTFGTMSRGVMAAGCSDLFVVLRVGAASVTVETGVLPPYLGVGAVSGTGPAQELFEAAVESRRRLATSGLEVFHNCPHQDLQKLRWERVHGSGFCSNVIQPYYV